MSQRRRKRKAGKVRVIQADGSVEIVRPGHFRRQRRKREQEKRLSAYERYLRSSHWKDLRVRILHRDKYRCTACGQPGPGLQVHHLTYARLGSELSIDLTTLCRDCHRKAHRR